MKALILAGGEGTRLRPLTCDRPKPMLEVFGTPVLEHAIRLLKGCGVTEIGLALGYMPGKIRERFEDGGALGVKLSYFTEKTPMGTAGAVRNAAGFLGDGDFLVMSGSLLTDVDLNALIRFHRERRALASVVIDRAAGSGQGAVTAEDDGRLTRFADSPDWGLAGAGWTCAGVYLMSPEILSLLPEGASDLCRDVFPGLTNHPKGLFGVNLPGYMLDISDISAYRRIHSDALDGKIRLSLPEAESPGIYTEEGAFVEQGALVRPPVYIGGGSRIMRGARLEPYSVIGRGVTVRGGAGIKRTVVLDGCRVEENAQLRGAVIDKDAVLGRGSAVYEQAVIGRGSIVGENCAVKPGVRVWPQKELPPDKVLRTNLIWGSCGGGRVWTATGLLGELGTEITPETMTRLGAAMGTAPGCDTIAAADSGSPAAAMLKSAFIGGVLSTGARLFDFGEQPLPVSRSGIRFHRLSAGVSVNVYNRGGTDYGEVRVIGPGGADPEPDFIKTLRGSFEREDFSRGDGESIREAEYLFEYKLFYLKNLINSTKKQSLGYKLLLGGGAPWAERLLTSAGSDLNCRVETVAEADPREAAKKVLELEADLGAVIDPSCQELTLIDGGGQVVDRDRYTLLTAMAVMDSHENPCIYVAVSAPSGVEELAARHGAKVVRTKNSPPDLMRELTKNSDPALLDQFIYRFDAVGALIKLMDFMKTENASLTELLSRLPETHMVHTGVDCEEAAAAMERLYRLHREQNPDLTDGLKLSFDRGWVLILPGGSVGSLSVTSQGYCEEYARELADMCVDEILGSR